MDQVGLGGPAVGGQAEVAGHLPELRVEVLPFADAQHVQVLAATQPPEGARGQLALAFPHIGPQVDEGQEVGSGVGEAGVELIGGRRVVGRTLPGILDGQARGDDQHLAQATVAIGLEHHAGEARIDGQPGQTPADRGQPEAAPRHRRPPALAVVRRQGAELVQQPHPVGHRPRIGRVHEREGVDVAQVDGRHGQDDRRQVGAGDLGIGEIGAGLEVLLGVEADADPVGHPATPARPLVGRRLRDRLDGQSLHLEPRAVARDSSGTRVDHAADAGDGQRRLGHVGGQHDALALVGGEDPVLLSHRQAGVERQDVGVGQLQGTQRVRGIAYLALARQEHQDVALALATQLPHRVHDGRDLVGPGSVADLHGKGAAGHLDDRRASEVGGEARGLDGGRRDDDLEVRPAGQELSQVAEDEVDVEAALVGLVHDDRVVGGQPAVVAQLGQQDPVGHELDVGGWPHLVGEAHRVADGTAHLDPQLGGQPVGYGARRQPTGLGVADHAVHPPPQLQADLGELGGLARPGLSRHHHHLVVTDDLGDLLTPLRHRQAGGIGDRGDAGAAQLDAPGALGRVGSPGP